jgi:hypothetical protein
MLSSCICPRLAGAQVAFVFDRWVCTKESSCLSEESTTWLDQPYRYAVIPDAQARVYWAPGVALASSVGPLTWRHACALACHVEHAPLSSRSRRSKLCRLLADSALVVFVAGSHRPGPAQSAQLRCTFAPPGAQPGPLPTALASAAGFMMNRIWYSSLASRWRSCSRQQLALTGKS